MDLGKWKVLKSKAIYGANASGKSNLLKAMLLFIRLVSDSVRDERLLQTDMVPFIFTNDVLQPSFFQMIFVVDGVQYRYGFETSDQLILSEWLFGTPGKKEVNFFTRDGQGIKINEKQFNEAAKLKEAVRPNALFLTVVKTLNGELAKKLVGFITGIIAISGLGDKQLYERASEAIIHEKMRAQIVKMLKMADVGIDSLSHLEVDAGEHTLPKKEKGQPTKTFFVMTGHNRRDKKTNEMIQAGLSMDLHESEGTKKMFELSPVILTAMEENRPLIMDEFDARFHPLLSQKLVELFNSEVNDKKTQFIFATHDTNLLQADLLRRDQICFVEKDKEGASHFYSLADFKGVRNDASFEKDYIMGRYGAIPFIGDFQSLFETHA
ncbi:MAG: ATP-binding protein, partial [Chitinophagaceae bacterium]